MTLTTIAKSKAPIQLLPKAGPDCDISRFPKRSWTQQGNNQG